MDTSSYDEVLATAFSKYSQHGFDLDEADGRHKQERERAESWHKCIAWAIDELDISSIDKLQLFSQCVMDLDSTLERMRRVSGVVDLEGNAMLYGEDMGVNRYNRTLADWEAQENARKRAGRPLEV